MPSGGIGFPHGSLSAEQIAAAFSAMPADVTFVGADNVVRYYSEYRIFNRMPECLDRDVLECHTPRTRSGVERLISELRDGWRDEAVFVETKDGRPVNVHYTALRDAEGVYLGVLEVASWADGEMPSI